MIKINHLVVKTTKTRPENNILYFSAYFEKYLKNVVKYECG